ncbi:MAG: FAD-dependent monooxygenase [Verrucomicrobia bacterium]|nr:FAD-dependent monooxygenase [Verrucomicrobiota bacterium]
MAFACDVMIAGGGPVGLTLGLALSHFGLTCYVAEANATTTRSPKMDVTNCRSMELFRAMAVSERLRDEAVPRSHNMDVSWITNMSGHEIHRFAYRSVDDDRDYFRAVNDGSCPREPNMRISQIVLEPVLRDLLMTRPEATIRYGQTVETFEQDAEGVTTTMRPSTDGPVETVRSRYLVGCDGGRSIVRQQLGFDLEGVAGTRPHYMVHFRSTDLDVLQRWGPAWHYQSPQHGVLICQDDREMWTLHAPIPPDTDPADIDPADLLTAFMGTRIKAQILQANPWVAHLLVAEQYRSGRVFLAGDSAHQYIPTGGYGMNTGVVDAFDLAWKLSAVQHDWGGEKLLDSYGSERRPIGLRNRDAARFHAETKAGIAGIWLDDIDEPGEAGDKRRAEIGAKIAQIGNAENESLGIELGYRYDESPVIIYEDEKAPPLSDHRYSPGTWPGSRLPSLFLEDGRALYDLLGKGFTLIAFSGRETGSFEIAAARRGVPLDIVQIDDPHARSILARDMILVRPDHHVAWRTNQPAGDAGAILDHVRGIG